MECFVLNIILAYQIRSQFISDVQNGFVPNRYSLTSMPCAKHDLSTLLHTMQGVKVLFLNLLKAFATVKHLLILAKLEALVVSTRLLWGSTR